ncbi:hypothetical protein RCL1_003544 [Eukaryota sp. TZLM3-RCL]
MSESETEYSSTESEMSSGDEHPASDPEFEPIASQPQPKKRTKPSSPVSKPPPKRQALPTTPVDDSQFPPFLKTFKTSLSKCSNPDPIAESLSSSFSTSPPSASIQLSSMLLYCCGYTDLASNPASLSHLLSLDSDAMYESLKEMFDSETEETEPRIPVELYEKNIRHFNWLKELISKMVNKSLQNDVIFDPFYHCFDPIFQLSRCFEVGIRNVAVHISLSLLLGLCEFTATLNQSNLSINSTNIELYLSKLNESIRLIFEQIFVLRYKDNQPAIRSRCLSMLTASMIAYPEELLRTDYTRYLGWMLHDNGSDSVVIGVINCINQIYVSSDSNAASMSLFFDRFAPKLVDLIKTSDNSDIRSHALDLFKSILTVARNQIDPDLIDDLIIDFFQNFNSNTNVDSIELQIIGEIISILFNLKGEKVFNSTLVLKICRKYLKFPKNKESVVYSTALLVYSLFDFYPATRDYVGMIDYLKKSSDRLSNDDSVIISSFLLSSTRRLFNLSLNFDLFDSSFWFNHNLTFFTNSTEKIRKSKAEKELELTLRDNLIDLVVVELNNLIEKFRGTRVFFFLTYMTLFLTFSTSNHFSFDEQSNLIVDNLIRAHEESTDRFIISHLTYVLKSLDFSRGFSTIAQQSLVDLDCLSFSSDPYSFLTKLDCIIEHKYDFIVNPLSRLFELFSKQSFMSKLTVDELYLLLKICGEILLSEISMLSEESTSSRAQTAIAHSQSFFNNFELIINHSRDLNRLEFAKLINTGFLPLQNHSESLWMIDHMIGRLQLLIDVVFDCWKELVIDSENFENDEKIILTKNLGKYFQGNERAQNHDLLIEFLAHFPFLSTFEIDSLTMSSSISIYKNSVLNSKNGLEEVKFLYKILKRMVVLAEQNGLVMSTVVEIFQKFVPKNSIFAFRFLSFASDSLIDCYPIVEAVKNQSNLIDVTMSVFLNHLSKSDADSLLDQLRNRIESDNHTLDSQESNLIDFDVVEVVNVENHDFAIIISLIKNLTSISHREKPMLAINKLKQKIKQNKIIKAPKITKSKENKEKQKKISTNQNKQSPSRKSQRISAKKKKPTLMDIHVENLIDQMSESESDTDDYEEVTESNLIGKRRVGESEIKQKVQRIEEESDEDEEFIGFAGRR